jgi:hypothetical protein
MLMPFLVRLIDSQIEAGDGVISQVADRPPAQMASWETGERRGLAIDRKRPAETVQGV